MANNMKNSNTMNLNWDCIITDVVRKWWLILLAVLATVLLTGGIVTLQYSPVYEAKTTFVIGTSGFAYNSLSSNLSNAATTTKRFSDITETSVLYKKVCEDLGIDSYDAKVSVNTIESSNLMELSVVASSPRMAYLLSESIVKETQELMNTNQYSDLSTVVMREIQSPVVPEEPYNSADAVQKMGYAGAIALVVIILLLGLISCYKDTIRSISDVNMKVDTKLLGTIFFEKKRGKGKKGKQFSMLITNPMLSFGYVESYRMLATRVKLALDKMDKNIVLVTSVSENEGKSTVSSNIAMALAQEGKRVLLIDGDFRKPALYKIFETEVTEDKDFCLKIMEKAPARVGHVSQNKHLYTLFSKHSKDSTWNEQCAKYLETTIQMLKKRVDYIIIDSAPMAFVSDTEEYASLADASILVIRQDLMEACYINDAIDVLDNTGTPVLGCVFNGAQRGFLAKTAERSTFNASNYNYKGKYYKSGKGEVGEENGK